MHKKCEEILKELEKEGKLKIWWGYTFPEKEELKLRLKDMLENEVDEKYYLSEEISSKFVKNESDNTNVIGSLQMDKWQDYMKRIYNIEKYSPTISTYQGGNTEPKILTHNIIQTVKENHGTVTATNQGFKIRKLTPKECWKLQGFDDEDFEKAVNIPTSNIQLYKQARKFNLCTSFRKNIY